RARRIFLHATLSRCRWLSPSRLERRGLVKPEREHSAVFTLDNKLRTSAAGGARASGKRKCRATFPVFDCIEKPSAERMLRPRRDAGAQASPETNEERNRCERACFDL